MSERPSTSDSLGTGRPRPPDELHPVDPDRLTRYDILLGSISVLLLLGWLLGQFSPVPVWAAMAAGGLVTLPLVADGLAVNPPR